MRLKMRRLIVVFLLLCLAATSLTGCLGTVIGTAADAAIEVGKVPFKVGGAVIDGVSGDGDDEEEPE